MTWKLSFSFINIIYTQQTTAHTHTHDIANNIKKKGNIPPANLKKKIFVTHITEAKQK